MFETQSSTTAKIAEALCKAHLEMGPAKKDSINPHYKSSYAGLPEVNEASIPVLAKYNIAVTQPTVPFEGTLYVVTTFLHTSGEWLRGYYPVIADKAGPQAMGSGTTYARRFSLSGMSAQSAVDDDGESIEDRGDQRTLKTAGQTMDLKNTPGYEERKEHKLSEPATEKQIGMLKAQSREMGWTTNDWHAWLKSKYEKASSAELTKKEASEAIAFFAEVLTKRKESVTDFAVVD